MKDHSQPSKVSASTRSSACRARHVQNVRPNHAVGNSTTFRPRHKKVAFVETVLIKEGLGLISYTDAEIEHCWLTNQDYQRIKKDAKRSIKYMQRGYDETTRDGLCTRGLEHLRDKCTLQELIQEKERLVEAVINEQWNQECSVHRSRNIAAISSKLSERSRDRASQKGGIDAAFVKNHNAYA